MQKINKESGVGCNVLSLRTSLPCSCSLIGWILRASRGRQLRLSPKGFTCWAIQSGHKLQRQKELKRLALPVRAVLKQSPLKVAQGYRPYYVWRQTRLLPGQPSFQPVLLWLLMLQPAGPLTYLLSISHFPYCTDTCFHSYFGKPEVIPL